MGSRGLSEAAVNVCGSTINWQWKWVELSIFEVGGMVVVAVKCRAITKNSDCEARLINYN